MCIYKSVEASLSRRRWKGTWGPSGRGWCRRPTKEERFLAIAMTGLGRDDNRSSRHQAWRRRKSQRRKQRFSSLQMFYFIFQKRNYCFSLASSSGWWVIGVLAGGVAGWGACLLLDSMDGCLDGCWPCQPPVSGQKGGQSPGLPALRVWMAGKLRGGGPPALQVHVSWSLGNCIQLPVRKLDTGREGAMILDQWRHKQRHGTHKKTLGKTNLKVRGFSLQLLEETHV